MGNNPVLPMTFTATLV